MSKYLVVIVVSLLLGAPAMATSFVVPTDEELVTRAEAITVGVVEGSYVRQRDRLVETVFEIRLQRVLKGEVRAGQLLRVVSPGGMLEEGRGVIVPAAAKYQQGEHVLVFANRGLDGEWQTTDLTLGRFEFVTSTRGDRLLVRNMEDVVGWDRSGQLYVELRVRREEGFLAFIAARVAGRKAAQSDAYTVEASSVTLDTRRLQTTADARVVANAPTFPAPTYTDWVSNQPIRWANMSAGVNFYKRSDQNISGASDGGVSVIQSGLAAWNNECGSLINLIYAGQRSTASANHDGVNVVEYNDPQSRVSGSWTGSGTIAITFLSFAGSHSFAGATWWNITDADVVFQNGYPATNGSFAPAMTHELGHGIGFRHSNQDYATGGACNSATQECASAAIMNSSVSGSYGFTLQPWDQNAAQAVYPGGSCAPTCSVPVITSEPTSRSITAGSSTTITVSATGTGPLSYQWFTGASGSTGSPIPGGTGSSITVSPASSTSYWVRVSNACGADDSSTATVTVTGTPAPTVNRTRADFDRDSRSELIWRNGNLLAMWDLNGRTLSNGDVFASVDSNAWRIEGYGDFTGDGYYDILFRNTSTNQVVIWVMNGRTLVRATVVASLTDARWSFDAFGDFTGDGRTDAIVRNSGTGQLALWEFGSSGDATSTGVVQTVADANWRIVGAGDFNGDGDDELLWRNVITNDMAMWEFSGRTLVNGGVFATVSNSGWIVQGIGDMNRDGRDDIVFRYTDGSIAVWDMNGRTIINGNVVARVSSPDWAIDAIGDFDADGDDEIIFFNSATRDVAMWEMANHTLINGAVFRTGVPSGWVIQPPFDPVR